MQIQLIFIVFFLILLLILIIGSFPFFSMLNKYYLKKKLKKILYFTIIVNIIFLFLFIFSRIINFSSFSRILNYYLGFLLYAFLISITFWTVYAILNLLKKEKIILKKYIAIILVIFFLIINIIAIYNFNKPIKVEEYNIYSNKILTNYTFIQVSDIQYGTVNKDYMEKVMKITYEQNPDFIVFTGDLIDFDYYKLEDFEIFTKSKVPIYFERGNHEFYHDPDRILSYLKLTTAIKLLINQKETYEELEIIGIDHNRSKYQLKNQLDKIELNESKFSILLYHEPNGVEFVIEKNIDLALFAHTHAGQIWPVTELIDIIYKYGDGYFKENNTIIYTTDGAGLWGPKMRLGSQNEIVKFNLISSTK